MDSIILILGSGDVNATGTAGEFTVPVSGLKLDPKGEYYAALIDVSFSNPGATNNSIFVTCDLVENQRIGQNYSPILYKTKPMIVERDPTKTTTLVYYEKENPTLQWRKVERHQTINNIRITISESDGTPIPNDKFSLVQLMIKRLR